MKSGGGAFCDCRIPWGQPFTASGASFLAARWITAFASSTICSIYAPRNLRTGILLITGSDIPHELTEKWEKARAARIQGEWVLGISDNRLNGNITINEIKQLAVFSGNSVGGFGDDSTKRTDTTVDGAKVATFRKANGDELALAGDHLPVRSIYRSNDNKITHFSDYNAPLHVEAPANPIDLTGL